MILPDDYPPDLPPPALPPKPRNPFVGRSASQSSSDHDQDPTSTVSGCDSQDVSRDPGPSSSRSADSTPAPPPSSRNDPLSEELPPAYTPAADVTQGETTIEYGPRRPFQPVVQPPVVPQQTGWPMRPQPTGPGWAPQYPPGFPPRPGMGPPGLPQFTQPPQHPLMMGRSNTTRYTGPPMSAPPIPNRPVSDFARDFYAAGANADMALLSGPASQYAPTPPRGPSGDAAPATQSTPSPGGPPARPEDSASSQIPDDGSPTKTPVPGHPLLRDGKILVYPPDFECKKCHNTGYKNYDPSHPCEKCWTKHSKSYSGPITYTPWSSTPNLPASGSHTNIQRPLPAFSPPQGGRASSCASSSGSSHRPSQSVSNPSTPNTPRLTRSVSIPRINAGYPGAAARVLPMQGGGIPMSPYLDPLQQQQQQSYAPQPNPNYAPSAPAPLPNSETYPSGLGSNSLSPSRTVLRRPPGPQLGAPTVQYTNRPPDITMRPGDPRLGGRLCWRCGGTGRITFFMLEGGMCNICSGVGRTY